MHQALCVEEILLNIFAFCYVLVVRWPPQPPKQLWYANADLAALARTCKTFKEPALQMIWAELEDLTPLVRCLPETSWVKSDGVYSLRERLERSDWDVILDYTRRVRALPRLRGSLGLSPDSIKGLSKPPTPLFPNLAIVGLHCPKPAIVPILRQLSNPRVTKLSFMLSESLGTATDPFGECCPAITEFDASLCDNSDTIPALLYRWKGLSVVNCYNIGLNVDALTHLSRSPSLSHLVFRLHDAVLDCTPPSPFLTTMLTFSALHHLSISSGFLLPVWRLFHRLCTPRVNNLFIELYARPSASDLISFFSALQVTCSHDILNSFSLRVCEPCYGPILQNLSPCHINFDRLCPLTVFANITSICLDTTSGVDLNECELLSLATSWPRLERFEVGRDYDWTESSAITPGGFLQLLERCRFLRVLYFMFDTRGYTEIPQGHPWRGLTMPKNAFIHLLNSPIEKESIEALSVFFHAAPHPDFDLTTHWSNRLFKGTQRQQELCDVYYDRWVDVRTSAFNLWKKRRNLRYSLDTRYS